MVEFECDCGAKLRADDEMDLTREVEEHMRAEHPEKELRPDQLQELMAARVRTL
jgi:predicted small metal-binding protein